MGNEGFDDVIRTEGGVLGRETTETFQCAEKVWLAGGWIPKSGEFWKVSAVPKTAQAKTWLLTVGTFGMIHKTFLKSHPDRDHRLDLFEMEFGLGIQVLESPYVAVYVGTEKHARQTAEELSLAIKEAGGSLVEFAIGFYEETMVA